MYLPMTDLIFEELEELSKFIEKMPPILLKMFNFDVEMIQTPEGIFGSQGMSFVYILSAVFSATSVGAIFSAECEKGTMDFLLVKPVKRQTVFLSKVSALMQFIHAV